MNNKGRSSHRARAVLLLASGLVAGAAAVRADGFSMAPSLNMWGVTGLIDMPSAEMQGDGALTTEFSAFSGIKRTTLSFQISPRLSASFRYTSLRNWNNFQPTTYYDRSFDLRYQILREGSFLPAVTVGLQDFIGTDLNSAEYLVATKHVTPKLKFTLGLGWGRLGSYGSITNTFGKRPARPADTGRPSIKQWFHGPVAPFGGVEWAVTDRLRFKAEYSSDDYTSEVSQHHMFRRRIPINAGIEYDLSDGIRVGVYELYGSEIGASLQFTLDPKSEAISPRATGGPGPVPVRVRPTQTEDAAAWSTSWVSEPDRLAAMRDTTAKALAAQGLALESLSVTASTAELHFRNPTYGAAAEAIGRAARILTQTMPASVETFVLVPVVSGMPATSVTIQRSDLESLEFAPNGATLLHADAVVGDGGPAPKGALKPPGLYPRLSWSLGPYMRVAFFDPDDPYRADLGIRLAADYTIAPGLILSGSLTKKIAGTLDQSTRTSNSVLPHVRSDYDLYDKQGDPALERLTLAWYFRPGENLFGRVTVGYLERMFGGISTEVMWQRPDSRLALGAEFDYVRQRDYDILFGFRPYSVAMGYVSAHYQFDRGYAAELDVGRYLAGDEGATLILSREFGNGWKVGAFATLTNVSFARFGEGSFDKGLFFSIPISWALGQPNLDSMNFTIRPIQRDGGAQLDVAGRLYDVVRAYRSGDLDSQWGRVFR